jgi:hypothetical protein
MGLALPSPPGILGRTYIQELHPYIRNLRMQCELVAHLYATTTYLYS